jgi:hypothetical protein
MKHSKQPDRLSRKRIALIVRTYEKVLRISLRCGCTRMAEMVKVRMAARYKADPKVFARWNEYVAEG